MSSNIFEHLLWALEIQAINIGKSLLFLTYSLGEEERESKERMNESAG